MVYSIWEIVKAITVDSNNFKLYSDRAQANIKSNNLTGLCVISLPAMGKSPAKWIKTVLFGKKSSKPNISKGRERFVNEKEVVVAARAVTTEFVADPPMAFHESINTTDNNKGLELENKEAPSAFGDREPRSQSTDSQGFTPQNAAYDPEKIKQEQAQQRHRLPLEVLWLDVPFGPSKGIIRLQTISYTNKGWPRHTWL